MTSTYINYRETVTSADEFTRQLCREILADPETLPSSREYAEFILTLPIKVDGHGAGFTPEPERKSSTGGNRPTSSKTASPGELIGATERQINALINMGAKKLIGDAVVRHLTVDIPVQDIVDRATSGKFVTKGEASKGLDFLFRAGWKPREAAPVPASVPQTARKAPVTQDGMYHLGDRIVKVQKSRQGDRLYAKELVQVEGRRGETEFAFEYAPGLIGKLSAGDRMTLEEAKAFGKLYEWCCVCGTRLTDEKSIDAGIGPICGGRV